MTREQFLEVCETLIEQLKNHEDTLTARKIIRNQIMPTVGGLSVTYH